MAAIDVIAVMNTNEERSLHPFFAKVDGKASTLTLAFPMLTSSEALLHSRIIASSTSNLLKL
jgi:hypothetical protein